MFYRHAYKYNLWCSLAMFISAYSDRESDCFNLITIICGIMDLIIDIDIAIITNITIISPSHHYHHHHHDLKHCLAVEFVESWI